MMRIVPVILLVLFASCGRHIMTEKEIQEHNERLSKCEEAVSSWIKSHALYPESYQSLGFDQYSESATLKGSIKVPNSENYCIFHSHKIKNIAGDTVVFSGYFKLEHDYFVDIIEIKESGSIGGAYPPQTQIWLNQFGKPISEYEVAENNKRQQDYADKTLTEIKGLKYESKSDEEKVNQALDTTSHK